MRITTILILGEFKIQLSYGDERVKEVNFWEFKNQLLRQI